MVTYKKRANVVSGGLLICHGDDADAVAEEHLAQPEPPTTTLLEPVEPIESEHPIPLDELAQDSSGKSTVYGAKKEKSAGEKWVDPTQPACMGSQLRKVLDVSFNMMADKSQVSNRCFDCLKLEENRPDTSTKKADDLKNTMHKFFTVFRKCFGDKSKVQTENMVKCATPIVVKDMSDASNATKPTAEEVPHLKTDVAAGKYPDFYRLDELVYGCFSHLVTPGEMGNPKFEKVEPVTAESMKENEAKDKPLMDHKK